MKTFPPISVQRSHAQYGFLTNLWHRITKRKQSTPMAKFTCQLGGDHLAALIRPKLAALTGKAVITGYPKLSSKIADIAGNLGRLAKRGDVAKLTLVDKTVLAFLLAEAFKASGSTLNPVAGDTISLTVNPPAVTPKAKPTPQEQLTLTGGVTATVGVEADEPAASADDDMTGSATVDIPWDRTPAKYEGLPVTVVLTIPSDEDWIKVFNS